MGLSSGADATFARLTGRERRLVRGMNVSELFRSDPPVALYDEDACALGWQGEVPQLRGVPPVRARLTIVPRRDPAGATIGHIAKLRPLPPSREDAPAAGPRPSVVPPKSPQHQLRNVLTVIAGNVEIIESMNRDQELRKRITLIHDAVDSALDIMAQMSAVPNGPPRARSSS